MSIKKGIVQQATDGKSYVWRGAQWARLTKAGKAGVSAPKKIQHELTSKLTGNKFIATDTKKASQWFKGVVDQGMQKPKKVSNPKLGSMVTFMYDAKHQDTLPYWDKHPLSIIIGIEGQSMLGLNVHYLSPMHPMQFMSAMLKFTGRSDFSDITDDDMFKVNWKVVSKVKFVEKTIHRYLFSHINSQVFELFPTDWEQSIFLPTSKFVGASQRDIWRA